jgi:hypothetical protein
VHRSKRSIGRIYLAFKKCHFDDTWDNDQLCIPYKEEYYEQIVRKHEEDIDTARKLTLGELSSPRKIQNSM